MGYGSVAVGVGIGGYIVDKLTPTKTITYAVIGSQSTGKSTLHASIYNRLQPVHQSRIPTTQKGIRAKTKLPLPNAARRITRWERRDYPHHTYLVKEQILELKPSIIFCLVDVDTWSETDNIEVLEAAGGALASRQYRDLVKPMGQWVHPSSWRIWEPWTIRHIKSARRCKLFVMVLNKIDQWEHLAPKPRAEKIRKVLDYYLKESEHLEFIKNTYDFHFVAASFQDGYYYPFNQMLENPKPLEKYFEWLVDTVVMM